MTHSYEHTHRPSSNAVVTAERATAAAPAERRVHTDARTHAKTFYERDGSGREVYGTYYNSNDDPSFQARYNNGADGSHAFVTTSSYTFVSNNMNSGSAGVRKPHRAPVYAPTAIVEEASPDPEPERRQRTSHTRSTPAAQPIVEEPDDDEVYEDDGYGRVGGNGSARGRREAEQRHPPHGSRSHDRYEMNPQKYQVSPFAPHAHMMMRDPFMDDFFLGPHNPFDMINAMQQRMSQQRAAMFGGVDPFAAFF